MFIRLMYMFVNQNAPDDSPLGRLENQMVTPKNEMLMARLFYGGHRVAIAGLSFSFRHFMDSAFSKVRHFLFPLLL